MRIRAALLFFACGLGVTLWHHQARAADEGGVPGEFSGHADIGPVKHAGTVRFQPDDQSYAISGAGANMWFARDEFSFVWKKMTGDFELYVRARFEGTGVDPHRKLGWMIRSSLAGDAAYVDATVHGDGLTSLQFRRTAGAMTEEVKARTRAPDVIQLARRGNRYAMSVARFGAPFETVELADCPLGDEVHVGLFVCSHNADVVEKGVFHDVRITIPAPADFRPYRDYIGSRLEILDIETGRRRVVHTEADSLQAPNWTRDGKALIYNRNGRIYRLDLDRKVPEPVDTGFATRNNNDHVLSFDGTRLGISHHSADHMGRSMIYTLPVAGGTPQLVTAKGPSYLHGWSPDGRFLLYTGERDGQLDIYRISVDGGAETRLTTAEGLDDGPEYAPDGRTIHFNSSRSGTMQLWRMNADGSGQTRLTDDGYHNWFPHVSPDGRSLVFLSFDRSVAADDHPFYKPVLLRLMPAKGGEARVVAYVYGGQGTINVPSWSPDGKRLAFVSNTRIEPPGN